MPLLFQRQIGVENRPIPIHADPQVLLNARWPQPGSPTPAGSR